MINKHQYEKIKHFAQLRVNKSFEHYKKRNTDLQKTWLFRNVVTAKLGEFHVYNTLKSKGYNLDEPCLLINPRQKHDADLYAKCKGISIHVKTCSHSAPVKDSWLVEKSARYVKYPRLDDWYALVTIKDNQYTIYWRQCAYVAYSNPIKDNLKTKLAIYLTNLNKQ